MYHRVRRKMNYNFVSAILLLSLPSSWALPRSIAKTDENPKSVEDNVDNNIVDFDDEYSVSFNKKYDTFPWRSNNDLNKESHRYTIFKDDVKDDLKRISDAKFESKLRKNNKNEGKRKNTATSTSSIFDTTATSDYSVVPIELLSTTENILVSILESTTEPDLTVIPLSTTEKVLPKFEIEQAVKLPSSTQSTDITTDVNLTSTESDTTTTDIPDTKVNESTVPETTTTELTESKKKIKFSAYTTTEDMDYSTVNTLEVTTEVLTSTENFEEELKANSTEKVETFNKSAESTEANDEDVQLFTELDIEDQSEVPEDYYDSKDIVPTKTPNTDALSVIFGLAGSVVESVVESVAERVVPKGIFDLFKRMQRQSEALEAERLRSREENGGLGQFGRGILKSISSGIGKPLSQLMAGVRDIGSLDSDRGFVNSLASGVTSVANVANSLADAFKDRVQAIYPGTVWCGDGHSAQARSSDLGLFFFTDTCCRQHDACKLFIKAGETKYGLTNTGLFTRSHCSCDIKFRECLRKTNSLVSGQIGLTYFNVLGPQCFRKAHPIVRCLRRTRITGQKCEEYEMDYSKPKMWQWFDNETF